MESVIVVKNLCKNYKINDEEEIKIIKNINFEVNKGDFVSIMGPSGSGKSTLLYLIGGLESITSGEILIHDKNITVMKDRQESCMRRKELGFVFQFYNLIPNLSVEENILLPIYLDGKKEKDYKDKVDELIEIVGLKERSKHTPRELSGGQQQRVAIARALINSPDIILADEPIGNLDSKSGQEIMELFSKINQEAGKTIVQVTHSEPASRYGNRVICIVDGQIVAS